jgi:hypothetical protein
VVFPNEIPVSVVSLPVGLEDPRMLQGSNATLVAGSVGMSVSKAGARNRETSVQPASRLWLLGWLQVVERTIWARQ